MKKTLCLAVLLVSSVFFAEVSHASSVKIGLMAPITGAFASEGQDMERVVQLMVDETNKAGGINGQKVELIVEDDGSAPRPAATAASRLVAQEVVAVIGTYGSSVTEATQDIYNEAGIVQIATGSTSIRLTNKGLEGFFRTCPRDDEQGRVAAKVITEAGHKKIAILHDNSAYAKGLADEGKMNLEASEGVEIVFFDALQPGERDYSTILTKMKGVDPDLLFFTGYYPEVGLLLRQMYEMQWSVPMLGGDAANNLDLVTIAGVEAAVGYSFVSPAMPADIDNEAAKNFLAAYSAKYDSQPSSIWSVLAGDAYLAIAEAIKAKGANSSAIALFLHDELDFEGLSGTIAFDKKGDRVGDVYRLYKVNEQGVFELQNK